MERMQFNAKHNSNEKGIDMAYKTQGIISRIQWTQEDTRKPGNPPANVLSFTLDPVAPYLFEETEDGKTKKSILFVNGPFVEKKSSAETEFVATFGDPSMSFAALILLKQNRTIVELVASATTNPIAVEKLTIY